MSFRPAQRKNAKLRLAISGTAGAGKTYSALLLAAIFGKKIAVMDSERGASEKYAGEPGLPPFDVSPLEEKTLQEYTEKVGEAGALGYDVLVIDSYSHSWLAAIEAVDKMGGSKFSNGWKVVSPIERKLVDAILNYPGHVIVTMRSKAAYEVEKDDKGRAVPKKVGMAPVARDGTDYEFDVMLDLTTEGGLSISKTRCAKLNGQPFSREDVPKIGAILKAWLESGATESAVDVMARRIRFASTDAELTALVPDMKALTDEERATLRPVYAARKAAVADAEVST